MAVGGIKASGFRKEIGELRLYSEYSFFLIPGNYLPCRFSWILVASGTSFFLCV